MLHLPLVGHADLDEDRPAPSDTYRLQQWPQWREQARMTAHGWRMRSRAWGARLAVLLAWLRLVVVLAVAYASGG